MIIHLYMYVLSKVIYVLTTETVWPKNPKVFTLWPFTEVCASLIWSMRLFFFFSKFKLSILYWDISDWGFPCGSVVKNLHSMQEMQETQVQSLSWEDPLEEGMLTHSRIPSWRITRTEEPRAWQVTVHSITQSQTQLRWLSTHTQHIWLLSTC